MAEGVTAFPLAWPQGWPRTPANRKKEGRFSKYGKAITVELARKRLAEELDRIGARYVVLSTNLELRLDGQPRSNGGVVGGDEGVCCYFRLKERATVLPCDKYDTVADNIAAIAAHIEATRAIERHGVGTLEQMFTGFQALRRPGPKPWREVLGFRPDERVTRDMVSARRRELARKAHPDAGGSEGQMSEINAAADLALVELSQ